MSAIRIKLKLGFGILISIALGSQSIAQNLSALKSALDRAEASFLAAKASFQSSKSDADSASANLPALLAEQASATAAATAATSAATAAAKLTTEKLAASRAAVTAKTTASRNLSRANLLVTTRTDEAAKAQASLTAFAAIKTTADSVLTAARTRSEAMTSALTAATAAYQSALAAFNAAPKNTSLRNALTAAATVRNTATQNSVNASSALKAAQLKALTAEASLGSATKTHSAVLASLSSARSTQSDALAKATAAIEAAIAAASAFSEASAASARASEASKTATAALQTAMGAVARQRSLIARFNTLLPALSRRVSSTEAAYNAALRAYSNANPSGDNPNPPAPGPATRLVLSSVPASVISGSSFAITVTAKDSSGNTASGYSGSVALASSDPAATLPSAVMLTNGVGSFNAILKTAGSRTLTASAGTLSVTSGGLTVNPANYSPASSIVSASASSLNSGSSINATLIAKDAFGNTTSSGLPSLAEIAFTSSLIGGTGSFGAVSSPSPGTYTATFTGSTSGSCVLGAALSGAAVANTVTVTILPGAASQLVITGLSSAVTAGAQTSFTVTARDSVGNVVPSYSQTLSFLSSDTSATLPESASFSSGTGTFNAILKTAGSHTLTATSGSLSITSQAIVVSAGAVSKLVFSSRPGSSTAGTAFPVVVQAHDSYGNFVSTASPIVTLSSSDPRAILPAASALTAGQATLSVTLRTAGSAILTASSPDLTQATTGSLSVSAGAPAQLAFDAQPEGGPAGTIWASQPVVTVLDSSGNTVTHSTALITLAIGANPGSGTLAGTTAIAATSGEASFAGLSINKSGASYTLIATSPGLTSATSSAFNVSAGEGTRLVFTTQPGGGSGGAAWAQQPSIVVQDANGNPVTTSTAAITVAIGTNPSAGTLSGTTTGAAVAGVRTFSGLSINRSGTGYTLIASSPGLVSATSAAFNITLGAASRLAFTTPAGGGAPNAVWTTQPVVTVQDAGGNTVTSSTASITLAIGTNPGSGTLTGTASGAASSGVRPFSGLRINSAGVGYTLTATSPGLASATSPGFSITTGATRLAITVAPTVATALTSFSVTVQARNPAGALVNTATPTVTWTSTDPQAILPAATALSAGTRTFTITFRSAGSHTITASSNGLLSATSASIAVSPGLPSKLAFTVPPGGGIAGNAWTIQPEVIVQDGAGNTITSSSASISLAIGTNPGNGTLSGTASKAAVSGVATFSGLYLNRPGNGYTLTATSGSLIAATSSAFSISTGSPHKLAFSTQPGGGPEGVAWSSQPAVLVQDSMGNTIGTSSAKITLVLGTNPSGGTLSGTPIRNAVSGQASFQDLSIDKAGTGYTLTATSRSLVAATSSAFRIRVASQAGCEPGKKVFTFRLHKNAISEEGSDDSYFNQDFSVPENCTEVTVKAWGAGGGGIYMDPGNHGGGGGFTSAILTVTPGEVLNVRVGQGGMGPADMFNYCSECTNWWYRIAGGGSRGGSVSTPTGGGGSFVFRGKDVLIAAGGGGGAGTYANMPGGAGGGEAGSQGLPLTLVPVYSSGHLGGGGGTQKEGGLSGGGDATAGTSMKGGYGGSSIWSEDWLYAGGGGGGGGYFGGGGGAGSTMYFVSGGGGGGSGFASGDQSILIPGSKRQAANQEDPDYQSGIGMGGISSGNIEYGTGGDGLIVIEY